MESSAPDPVTSEADTAVPETGAAASEPAVQPAPAPSLSLDDVPVVAPALPDLAAVAATPPTAPSDPEPVGFDLGDDGYAEKLAQSTYGQPAPTPSAATAPGAPAPYAVGYQQQAFPSAPADPYTRIAPNEQYYAQAQPSAQPYYAPQPAYQPVPYQAQQSETLSPDQERTWASAAHWSALVAGLVGLGFLGPLLVYLIQGPKSAWVKAQAAESLNFEITYIIGMLASLVLMLVVVGFVTIFVFPVLWLIFRIIATVATSQGRDYRYPVNIRMVK